MGRLIVGFSNRKCGLCHFPLGAVWLKEPDGLEVCADCSSKRKIKDLIEALARNPQPSGTRTPASPKQPDSCIRR